MLTLIRTRYLCVVFLLCIQVAYGNDGNPNYLDNLTGDWMGNRLKLYQKGVDIEFVYRGDALYNVAGGFKKGGDALGNVDFKVSIDGDKLYNLSGSKIFIHVLNNHGGKPNEKRVLSAQGIDNIEVKAAATKLYQAWISQDFFDEKFSILTGLYDLNSEFYVTPSAGLFMGPTYGIGSEIAVTGVNGPSIFPATSLAIRAKLQPTEKLYLQAAIFDAIPGNPDKPKVTNIHLKKKDGALLIAEAGTNSDFGNYAVGLWKYTKKFDNYVDVKAGNAPVKKISQGVYVMAEKVLYKHNESAYLTGFARVGKANQSVSMIDYSWSSGLVYHGFISGRDDSQIGFAVSQAKLSKKYRKTQHDEGSKVPKQETGLELTISDKLTPWLQVQPDIQYIFNPAAVPVDLEKKYLKNAFVIGIKTVITF
jgi:porin